MIPSVFPSMMVHAVKIMLLLRMCPLALLVVGDCSPSWIVVPLFCIHHAVATSSSSSSSTTIDEGLDRGRRAASSSSSSSSKDFYQRYKVYPPYCGDPTEMATRSIPPLVPPQKARRRGTGRAAGRQDAGATTGEGASVRTQLVHVTAVIRHGARTPAHNSHSCWDGHWDGQDGTWDCDLKTLLTSRPPSEDGADGTGGGHFVVEKIYDAFARGGGGDAMSSEFKNLLNGTCQVGQLIQQGYDQQVINGQFLREAYIYNGSSSDDSHQQSPTPSNDPRMRLWDTSAILSATSSSSSATPISIDDYPFSPRHLRYRSDDDQRTLASGQVLLTSMFGPELERAYRDHKSIIIPHHTADRSVDILSAREDVCPGTRDAGDRAKQSAEYQAYNSSDDAVQMRKLVRDHLAVDGATQDCLMTTICTDRKLPDVIDDYAGEVISSVNTPGGGGGGDDDDEYTKLYGPNRFVRLRNYVRVALFWSYTPHVGWEGFVGVFPRCHCRVTSRCGGTAYA
jgi:hypothetical protein